MLKSKLKALVSKGSGVAGFEIISDKRAAHVLGGDCTELKRCQTYTGPCSTLDDRGGCGVFVET